MILVKDARLKLCLIEFYCHSPICKIPWLLLAMIYTLVILTNVVAIATVNITGTMLYENTNDALTG